MKPCRPSLVRLSIIVVAVGVFSLESLAQPGTAVNRVNCGGPDYTDWGGNLWVADTGYYNTGSVFSTSSPIAITEADPLYQTVRFDDPSSPEMMYTFPVTRVGTYMVRFRFAEIDPTANSVGARVFDIALEGRIAFDDFDIVSEAGYLTAIVKEANVWVSDGALNIEFRHVTGNPLVNGIEVRYLGTTEPHLAVTPGSLDFGSVTVGSSSTSQSLTVKNDGTASVTVSSVKLSGAQKSAFTTDAVVPFTLAAGASKTVKVTFKPTVAGSHAASLAIYSNATNSPNTVGLAGSGGVSGPALQPDKTSVTFSGQAVGTTSAVSKVVLTNTGSTSLDVTALTLGGTNGGDFAVTSAALPITLAPAATTDLNLTFKPTAAGARSATLTVASTDPAGNVVITLSGQGVTVASNVVYRINAGGPNYTDPGGNPWVSDAGYFNTGKTYAVTSAIALTEMDPIYQAQRFDEPTAPELVYSLPVASGTYRVRLHFAEIYSGAGSVGARYFDVKCEGSLVLDNLDVYKEVGLNAALVKEFTAPVTDGTLNLEFIHQKQNPMIEGIEVLRQALSPSPASATFAGQLLGTTSSATKVTLTNTGSTSLDVTSLTVGGANAGDFAIASAVLPITLAPAATTDLNVTFTPGAAGARNATLTVASTDPVGNLVLTLSGTGLNPPKLQVSPASVQFSDTTVNTSAGPLNLTLTNAGDVNLTVQSLAISGTNASEFALSPVTLPLTIAAKASANVGITFTPAAQGARSATLTIGSNDPAGNVTVSLSGQGVSTTSNVVYRINAGGPNYTDPGGNLWVGDAGYFNTGKTYAVTSAIALTEMDPIYQAQRFDEPTTPEMMYSLPVASGTYRVRLHFAEIYSGAGSVGARYFDVKCEGKLALDNLDVFSEVGLNAALVKEFTASVTDGTLNLEFIHQKQNPMIQGIEVLRIGHLTPQPTVLDWGHVQIGTTQTKTVTLTNDSNVPVTVSGLSLLVNAGAGNEFTVTLDGNSFAGGPQDVAYSTSVVIAPGASATASVAYAPAVSADNEVWIELTGNFDPVQVQMLGSGTTSAGDPFLHVVIGVAPYAVDYDGDGSEVVSLTGSGSHTHELGRTLNAYQWKEGGAVFATTADTVAAFALGAHTVSLTIFDSNSPPRTLTDSSTFRVVTPSNVPGALVSYYDGANGGPAALLDAVPANPDFAEVRPSVSVTDEFGYVGGSSFTANVMVRVQAKISVAEAGSYTFVASGGSSRRLFLNGAAVSGAQSLAPGTYNIEGRFAVDNTGQLPLDIAVAKDANPQAPLDPTFTFHDETQMAPVINTAPAGGSGYGGELVELGGIGFFPSDQVFVNWGATTLSGAQLTVTPSSIRFTTPPGEGTITVTVQTPQGTSNPVAYEYSAAAPVPVQFSLADLVAMTSPTQATWGNDGRLYVGAINGVIKAFTFDDNYNVTNTQTITALQGLSNNNILGIAVNPFDPPGINRIYVAHSLLFANGGACFTGFSPYSGQISVLTGPNFSTVTPLITGLPVSNHDHGINGLEFDLNGNLLICVGGNTNAGVEHCNMGDLPESPLSAAVLKAPVWKPGFNGTVTYVETATGQPNNDQVYGDIVDVAPGVSVSVFAAGFRNPYDLVMTTKGILYNADNGPNASFGDKSLTATTSGPGPTAPDELNLIEEGHYYGHPNRNHGRYDNRQNTYKGPTDVPANGDFTQCLTTYLSSTNGIAEYRAQTFQGAMRGEIVTQKWNGVTYRVKLAPDGRSVLNNTTLNVSLAGLDIVPGPGGVLLGIDYTDNKLVIARPVDATLTGLKALDIFPWRGPVQGGTPFVIGGVGFGTLANTQVTIGDMPAQLTSVSSTRIRGILPSNPTWVTAMQDVVVTVDGVSVTLPKAFQYLLPPGDSSGSKAYFSINPGGTLVGSSTYSSGSFKITNNSTSSQKINRVEIDLSSAMFPDNVFDPNAEAGDPVGKDFTLDSGSGVGVVSHAFRGPRDGGYDKLEVIFNNFDPGETLTFSTDVDPTSMKGAPAPGPGESGSVAGIELIGARITVYFSDGTVRTGETYRIANSQTGSEAYVEDGLAERPALEIVNQTQPQLTVNSASQKVRVSGAPGATYTLIRTEGALYTDGSVGGGFDIDPYEANTAIAIQEYSGTVGPGGFTDIPVTLTKSVTQGGYNYFRAVLRNAQNRPSPVSQTVVMQYAP